MVFPLVLPKIAARWLQLFQYRPARKLRRQGSLHRTNSRAAQLQHQQHSSGTCSSSSLLQPSITKCSPEGRGGGGRSDLSLLSDLPGTILRSNSYFPYFMLVAFEGGSLLRALLLLLSYPLLFLLGTDEGLGLRIMVFVTFCGLRMKDVEIVSRAVLPKFYLEDLNSYSCRLLASAGRRVVVTRMPRVMVERFLREYLEVGEVVGSELQMFKGYFFTGLISSGGASGQLGTRSKALRGVFGEKKADVGLVSYRNPHDHQLFIPHCKETYMVTRETSGPSAVIPRDKYPKPLIFHDGRLAFLPTPSATLFLFLYLPIGIALAIARIFIGIALPYKLSRTVAPALGVKLRVENAPPESTAGKGGGVLYVCNHRTLLDPVMLTGALARPLTAVTYSLSPVSELLAPIRTVRLTRNRALDADRIRRLLEEGDLVVCPEGTTCREPYLLRFSALFAELADEMEPVAVDAKVSMFYGTTASGYKFLDPVFFLMNPRPEYDVRFLGRVPKEYTCAGGGLRGVEVANRIQRQLGDALGFECTGLTRKDKYLMLAGNDGVVEN
ncbi:glycerol-3-phosphate acyltransferase 1-like [Iris pallida]|uniref:Glycerol-3-phosphate acyltransferase 1-like n=1 Tax=Iris pallida TaxID=29817 RepID=A0AAX6G990_IRIPA|nr:glycerol-3-phosphate acyltransferase 1-like [Iris pallida]KAJ6824938.1 glycerol-3-phosphate acyltransferase 1-like [Iris pallida]